MAIDFLFNMRAESRELQTRPRNWQRREWKHDRAAALQRGGGIAILQKISLSLSLSLPLSLSLSPFSIR